MYTEFLRRAVAATLGVLIAATTFVLPSSADERAAASWLRQQNPIVLLVVVDGLRADALDATAPWDGPLMPLVQRRRSRTMRWENVWAECSDPRLSTRQLLVGGGVGDDSNRDSRGFGRLVADGMTTVAVSGALGMEGIPSWSGPGSGAEKTTATVRDEELRLLAAVGAAAKRVGPTFIFARLDHLRTPWLVRAETLRALDPRPWADAPSTPIEIELLDQKRMRQAWEIAHSAKPLRARPSDHSLEIYRWVNQAAHRELDGFLNRLFVRGDENDLSKRLTWILTASAGTAYDQHGLDEVGQGTVLDALHVPLWWHFPESLDLAGVDRNAHTLRQLAETIDAWWENAGPGAGLFGPALEERFAWGRGASTAGSVLQEWTHFRWSTDDFTIIDQIRRPPRLALYDRRIDPHEFNSRGAEVEALWDSLRTELRQKVVGKTAELLVEMETPNGNRMQFAIGAAVDEIEVLGQSRVKLLPYGQGALVQWTPAAGTEAQLRLRIPGEETTLKLRREWLGVTQVQLGSRTRVLPVDREWMVLPGSGDFMAMLDRFEGGTPPLGMRWQCSGWLDRDRDRIDH